MIVFAVSFQVFRDGALGDVLIWFPCVSIMTISLPLDFKLRGAEAHWQDLSVHIQFVIHLKEIFPLTPLALVNL